MDRNIRYVREHRIPALLNDMVMHLVATKPDDPISALVSYLEDHEQDWKPIKPTPPPGAAKSASARPTPTENGSQQQQKAAATPADKKDLFSDMHADAHHEEPPVAQSQPKQKGTVAAPKPRPKTSNDDMEKSRSARDRQIWLSAAQHARPKPQKDEVDSLIRDLLVNERDFHEKVTEALSGKSVLTVPQQTALSNVSAISQNALELMDNVSQNHRLVNIALEAVRSGLSFQDYTAMAGFRLLFEIESNERLARREVTKNVKASAQPLSGPQRELLEAFDTSSQELEKLALRATEHQLEVSLLSTRGRVNPGIVEYSRLLSDEAHTTVRTLHDSREAIVGGLPRGTVTEHASKVPPAQEIDRLIREIIDGERIANRVISDLALATKATTPLGAALTSAVEQSKTFLTVAESIEYNNQRLVAKAPSSYIRAIQMLNKAADEEASALEGVHATHGAVVVRVGSAATAHLTDAIRAEVKQEKFDVSKATKPTFDVKAALDTLSGIEAALDDMTKAQDALILAVLNQAEDYQQLPQGSRAGAAPSKAVAVAAAKVGTAAAAADKSGGRDMRQEGPPAPPAAQPAAVKPSSAPAQPAATTTTKPATPTQSQSPAQPASSAKPSTPAQTAPAPAPAPAPAAAAPATPSSSQVINVGPSDTNTKRVAVPGVVSADNAPANKQEAGWGDRFQVTVHKDAIEVRRTDYAGGWGQGLQIRCVVAHPQVINVGPSDANTKRVAVPGVVSADSAPANKQEAGWGDRFQVTVHKDAIEIRRTDHPGGWGQGLQIRCMVVAKN